MVRSVESIGSNMELRLCSGSTVDQSSTPSASSSNLRAFSTPGFANTKSVYVPPAKAVPSTPSTSVSAHAGVKRPSPVSASSALEEVAPSMKKAKVIRRTAEKENEPSPVKSQRHERTASKPTLPGAGSIKRNPTPITIDDDEYFAPPASVSMSRL